MTRRAEAASAFRAHRTPSETARPWVPRPIVSARRHARGRGDGLPRPRPGRRMPPMTAVPGRLRLTVLGCSTALPAPRRCRGGIPRRVGRHCHPPRCRAGRRQPARSSRRSRGSWRGSSSGTCTPTISSTSPGSATCSRGPVVGPRGCPSICRPVERSRLDDARLGDLRTSRASSTTPTPSTSTTRTRPSPSAR